MPVHDEQVAAVLETQAEEQRLREEWLDAAERHRLAVARARAQGMKITELARLKKVTRQRVKAILRSSALLED
jgi:phage terminase Nu1 subunit (DNA packaging protein)